MTYYRRSNYRSAAPKAGRWMDLRYAGTCAQCRGALPAGTRAFYDPSDRTVCCTAIACAEPYGATEEKFVWPNGSAVVLAERRYRRS